VKQLIEVIQQDMVDIHRLQEDNNKVPDHHMDRNNHNNRLHQQLHLTVKHRYYLRLVHRFLQLQVVLNHMHQRQLLPIAAHLLTNHQSKECLRFLGLKIIHQVVQVVHHRAKTITIDPIRFVHTLFYFIFF
jgi:hypothetical protein